MSARRTDTHRIQVLVRLHRLGQSQRAIAEQLGMGRDTVRIYQGKLRESPQIPPRENRRMHI